MQDNKGPAVSFLSRKRGFHDGPHALEEIAPQSRLAALWLRLMRKHGRWFAGFGIGSPSEILLNGHGETGTEGPVDSVCPAAIIGVTVVSVKCWLVVVQ